jgi:hypothetical protein
MGQFSWKTSDTDMSIKIKESQEEIDRLGLTIKPEYDFTVYMKDNKGNVWEEPMYEGYGVFGGKDYYVLLAEMNGLKAETEDGLRMAGIDLAFDDDKACLFPNLFQNKTSEWNKNNPSHTCRSQGWDGYISDEDDDDDDDYWD